jgi:hypothetical protein
LLQADKVVKPYSATFSNGHEDSVWRAEIAEDRRPVLLQWWQGVSADTRLADLLSRPGSTLLIAAGASYVDAMAEDIAEASEADRTGDGIAIISAGSSPGSLTLPVRGAQRALLGGTRGSLNTRTLAWLAERAADHGFRRDAMSAALEDLRVDEASIDVCPRRRTATDEEVAEVVQEFRARNPDLSRSRALGLLRQADIACEQRRFAGIWGRLSN